MVGAPPFTTVAVSCFWMVPVVALLLLFALFQYDGDDDNDVDNKNELLKNFLLLLT